MGAIATRYADVEQWKKWAGDSTAYFTNADGVSLDDVVGEDLDAASRKVEGDCGRIFYLASGEVRTFRTDDDGTVDFVDLCADAIITVKYDADADDVAETELADTDYLLLPLTDERGRAPDRYQSMKRRKGAANWPAPGAIVTIEGDWGYVETDGSAPPDIVKATILMAGRLFARREAKLGSIAVPGVGTVGVAKGPDGDYVDLIRNYIRTDDGVGYAVT